MGVYDRHTVTTRQRVLVRFSCAASASEAERAHWSLGETRDACARFWPPSLAASATEGLSTSPQSMPRKSRTDRLRLTHHVQDAGAAPAPGSGDDDPWHVARDPPAYGSWLGGCPERPLTARHSSRCILTIALITANLVGIGLAVLLENVAFPFRIVSDTHPCGSRSWRTRLYGRRDGVGQLRQGAERGRATVGERGTCTPSRNTAPGTLAPAAGGGRRTLICGQSGGVYHPLRKGLANRLFIPQVMFSTLFCGILVAHRLLHAPPSSLCARWPPSTRGPGLPPGPSSHYHRRSMVVWLLSSGVPLFSIALLGILGWCCGTSPTSVRVRWLLIVSSATLISGTL